MNLKWHFIFWGVLLYSAAFIALAFLYSYSKWFFLGGEILLLASLIMFVILYRKLVKPVDTIGSALSLLKERNFNTKLIPVGQKEIDNLIDVYNKMTQQLREERIKLRENNYFLEQLIEAGTAGIIIFDFDDNIIKLNSIAAKLLAIELPISKINLNDINGKMANELSTLQNGDNKIIRVDGVKRYRASKMSFMDQGFKRPFIMIEELTQELIKAERRSYEKVIRMMSHEVNNSVCAVNSIIESVIDFNKTIDNPATADICHALQVSHSRNNNLAQFMKNFSEVVKIPVPVMVNFDMAELTRRTVQLMRPIAQQNNIQFIIDVPQSPLIVNADAIQIEQVIINSIKNSIEAIDNRGEINVTLTNQYLSITDNGSGISEVNQEKLFTPFFSTKPTGQGIGLTVIREILTNNGMSFSLKTTDGITEFSVEFGYMPTV